MVLKNGQPRTALEELIRWRLWNRTGGGLMAELGSDLSHAIAHPGTDQRHVPQGIGAYSLK